MNLVSVKSQHQQSSQTLPPLAVIALNRMGFGPKPGDIDAFNALGNSDDERLNNYIDQQLNYQSIDDNELQVRVSAAGL